MYNTGESQRKHLFSDCAKFKVQAAKDHLGSAQEAVKDAASNAKDHLNSAQETVKDAAKGATVNSLVNNAKDHLDSAQEAVKDAAKGATKDHLDSAAQEAVQDAAMGAAINSLVNNAKGTLASVSDEIKSRGKCMAALKPCVMKCGIDVPSEGKDGTTESELQSIDTKDLTKSGKKCMKNVMLVTKTAPMKANAKARANANARQGNARQGKHKNRMRNEHSWEVPRPPGIYMVALKQKAPWITAKRWLSDDFGLLLLIMPKMMDGIDLAKFAVHAA